MSNNTFQYFSIDPLEREIRLLTVIPDDFHEPVRCRLSKTSLKEGIYNAISYVWGSDPSTSLNRIDLNGLQFNVTPNLHSALRRLRSPKGSTPKPLWVDAVCINQRDTVERNWQVSIMGDIYAAADRVIIWLGEADENSDAALDAIPLLAADTSGQAYKSHTKEAKSEQQNALAQRCSTFFFELADRRAWFSRLWIVQELALARNDPLVVCGTRMVPWSTLIRGWGVIAKDLFTELGWVRVKDREHGPGSHASDSELQDEDEVEFLGSIKIDLLDDLRRVMQKSGGDSMRQLLINTRSSEATDPRDKVYGLLGLFKHSETPVLADYRKPCAAVYTDAMSHMFSTGEGPYFLSGSFLPGISSEAPYIPSLPSTIKQPHLPSWVPDFSRQTGLLANQPSGITFHPPAGFSASGAGSDCKNGVVLYDNRTLQIEGLVIDTVDHILPAAQDFDQFISQLPTIVSMVADANERPEQFDASIAPLIRQFKTKEPRWKVLVSNKRYLSGYDSAPADYEDMHLNLLDQAVSNTTTKTAQGTMEEGKSEYRSCLESHLKQRTFFTTTSGFFGTCVPDTREDDVVAILFGSPVPFVLRPAPQHVELKISSKRPIYYLVGAAYVGGIMNGEMVDELYCEDLMDSTTFFLQ